MTDDSWAVERPISLLRLTWPLLRAVLPYPDFWRRLRMRRQAFRLVTCSPWPEDNETGADAAQLALLRLLWLQRRVRRATILRCRDEAAS